MEKSSTWLNLMLKNVSLILFVALLGVIYIANVHVAERKQMRIEELKKNVEQVKWQYMGIENDLLLNSSPSQIEDKVKNVGLEYSAMQPKSLEVIEENQNQ